MSICKTGIALAVVTGGFHLCWSMLVAIGWAQAVIDFLFWAHFIKPVYVVEPFEGLRAAILVATTALIGFLLGAVFAAAWNAWAKLRS